MVCYLFVVQEMLKFMSRTNTGQVHADASKFAAGVTKEQAYKQVFESAEVLLEGQRNWVSPSYLEILDV